MELEKYEIERSRRSNIYNLLRSKMVNFGRVDINKMVMDFNIPPHSELALYFKTSSPNELDRYHEKIDNFLKYKINDVKNQIQILQNIIDNKKVARKYEKRNFTMHTMLFSKNVKENIFYEMIATALIYANKLYLERYRKEDNEKNIFIIDPIISESFNEVICKTLNYPNITFHLNKFRK